MTMMTIWLVFMTILCAMKSWSNQRIEPSMGSRVPHPFSLSFDFLTRQSTIACIQFASIISITHETFETTIIRRSLEGPSANVLNYSMCLLTYVITCLDCIYRMLQYTVLLLGNFIYFVNLPPTFWFFDRVIEFPCPPSSTSTSTYAWRPCLNVSFRV